jgi:hypothetical protein
MERICGNCGKQLGITEWVGLAGQYQEPGISTVVRHGLAKVTK